MRVIIVVRGSHQPRGKRKSCVGCPFCDDDGGTPGLCSDDLAILIDRGCPQIGKPCLTREYRGGVPIKSRKKRRSTPQAKKG
jgi:hypothetical protein